MSLLKPILLVSKLIINCNSVSFLCLVSLFCFLRYRHIVIICSWFEASLVNVVHRLAF